MNIRSPNRRFPDGSEPVKSKMPEKTPVTLARQWSTLACVVLAAISFPGTLSWGDDSRSVAERRVSFQGDTVVSSGGYSDADCDISRSRIAENPRQPGLSRQSPECRVFDWANRIRPRTCRTACTMDLFWSPGQSRSRQSNDSTMAKTHRVRCITTLPGSADEERSQCTGYEFPTIQRYI